MTKPYLQDMLLWLQREKCIELKENKEELGRQILLIHDYMELLDKCTGNDIQGRKQTVSRKPLNNRE